MIYIAFYKGTRPKLKGVFNRLVRWWTNGPHSHVELCFKVDGTSDEYVCWSSSGEDGGVRRKEMRLCKSRWDIVDISDIGVEPSQCIDFFRKIEGSPYDIAGLLGFVWRRDDGGAKKWFCSECVAAAIGLNQPWRYDPNMLYAVIMSIKSNR